MTVSSALISPTGDKPLTPAMVSAIWAIGDELDRRRISSKTEDAVWLKMPSQKLRAKGGRSDNVWLRECLNRLTGLKVTGEYRGDPWGAVMVAEYHIEERGTVVRLMIPPAAIQAIRAPETFAKLEYFAAYQLQGHARILYAALADKKRMQQKYWEYTLDEIRQLLGIEAKKSYQRWDNLKTAVLDNALKEINDYGTVKVSITPKKIGRSINSVRFDWEWKTLDEARITEEENEQPAAARHMNRKQANASPLTETIDLEEAIAAAAEKDRQEEIAAEKAACRAWLAQHPGRKMKDYLALTKAAE